MIKIMQHNKYLENKCIKQQVVIFATKIYSILKEEEEETCLMRALMSSLTLSERIKLR